MNKYVKKMALMIPILKRHYEEDERLRTRGIKYRSCSYIDNFVLQFLGNIDTEKKCIVLCCNPYQNFPRFTLCEKAEETIKGIAKGRAEIIAESIRFSLLGRYAADEGRKFTSGCAECPQFRLNNWVRGDGLIHTIALSMYPSPCQCKCIYCCVAPRDKIQQQLNTESRKNYEKLFDVIEWVQKNGMTAKNLAWYLACGEITIHPFKSRIFSLIKDQHSVFVTNCFIFDEKVAANLAANKQSIIEFSVDSGTPETYQKVKGLNNFDTVIDNVAKYLASGARPEQICIRYIVLPGINDNQEDYQAIIDIMKKRLKIRSMWISVDMGNTQRELNIRPAAYLCAMLHKNKISVNFTELYLREEIEKINVLADELLKSGEV